MRVYHTDMVHMAVDLIVISLSIRLYRFHTDTKTTNAITKILIHFNLNLLTQTKRKK